MPSNNDKQRLKPTADEPISVTIDASDLSVASAEPLRNIISRYGRLASARAFADFQQPCLSDLAVQLYQMGFTLVHCPTWPNGDGYPKSVVSDVMAQDLRDQVEELDEVETFLVIAASRDYIAVANALRRHDRRVVVVAEEAKVCRELRMCADEFAMLPPTRPERHAEMPRISRVSEASRPTPEVVRPAAEVVRSVPEVARPVPEVARPVPEVARPVPEVVRPAAEATRSERSEPQDSVKLPTDSAVVAEVKRIVAAEGICTPRRLARALCPVDRTATGELRSRIANRIQALVDAGKLVRERLVVGGTSVETILVRDERNGRSASPPEPETAPAAVEPPAPMIISEEPEAPDLIDLVKVDGMILGDSMSVVMGEAEMANRAKDGGSHSLDLDALVESVLMGPDPLPDLSGGEATPDAEASEALPEPPPVTAEAPKRSRTRRRAPAKTKAPVVEGDGTT